MNNNYELIKKERIEDVHADGYLYLHKKSGARVMVLANDDENKVFNIAFRTPPASSTGVAHIIEHTVLCGSDKFPLKDPFVELVKGSVNTFLNAMTYPDKTMYPLASTNDKDFANLMDVYLDAVFHPNIYKNRMIFEQEGWHYDLTDRDAPLKLNGVVYNEMKGAFSSAEEVLSREVFNTLFPDTPYGVESGGDPGVIPSLSYEEFLDFHRKYYHPSNSYIYLYGDMDVEERLAFLDEQYLSTYEKITVDSVIPEQKPFRQVKDDVLSYPILAEDEERDNTYLSYSCVVGNALDLKLDVAFSVLEYVLLNAPGAPIKQALLDAHVGKDIDGNFEDGILQPYFHIVASKANPEDKERFLSIIDDTLKGIVNDGIDKKAILAGINYFEFRYREADYASYPKGLMYGINVFDSWLYCDEEPWLYLEQLSVFEELKDELDNGYFESLIETYLLDNPHASVVTLVPEKGLQEKRDRETAEKLAAYKASLSGEAIEALLAHTQALKAFQESEDSDAAKRSIPILTREDLGDKTIRVYNTPHTLDGTTILQHDVPTNGISYVTLFFDTKHVPDHLIPAMGLLKSVLGYISTKHFTYNELFNEINANTGGLSCGLQVFNTPEQPGDCTRMFGVRFKALYEKVPFAFEMVREILTGSKLSDTKRLGEIVSSLKARMQQSIPGAGHQSAVMRASSYFDPASYFQEQISGISFYKYIEELEKHFDERKDDLVRQLSTLMTYIFRPENLFVNITADEEGYSGIGQLVTQVKSYLHTEALEEGGIRYRLEQKNEAYKTPGQVQFVAACGNFKKAGLVYTGALRILRTILNYDYLWMNLRVTGGAYGCMSGFRRNGDSFMVSYRDPHLKRTLSVFAQAAEYIRKIEISDRDMTKYVIGTIGEIDAPLTPSAKGMVSLTAYFNNLSDADLTKERGEVLHATAADIRGLASYIDAIVDQKNICVIGSAAGVEKDGDVFREILNF